MKLFEFQNRAGFVFASLPGKIFVQNRYTAPRFSACIALCVLVFACCRTLLAAQSPAEPSEISSFSQFYALSAEQAAKHLPIRLRATVICYDAGWAQLYLHDGRGCSYLRPSDSWTRLRRGEYVEVTGQTTSS